MSGCSGNCSSCGESCSDRKPESLLAEPNKKSNVKKVIAVVSGKGGFRLNIAQPFSSCKKKLPHFHNFVHTAHPVPLK